MGLEGVSSGGAVAVAAGVLLISGMSNKISDATHTVFKASKVVLWKNTGCPESLELNQHKFF